MERLNAHVAKVLDQQFVLGVCGPAGCGKLLPDGVVVREHGASLMRFLPGCLVSAWRLARDLRPVLVMAGSGLTAPVAWLIARLFRARAVAFLHGLDLVVASRVYQIFWMPFLRRLDLVLVNSRNTRGLAVGRGVPEAVIEVLHPGTVVPGRDVIAAQRFRRERGLGDRPLLLSVGRLTPRKGLASFVREALTRVHAECPDAVLLVIGADAQDALARVAGSERARVEQAAREAGVESSIVWMAPCDDATLSAAYHAADVHVFPVQEIPGDVEGFGMVAIEAAAHGTPTVAFAVGGVPDAVVEGRSGRLIAAGDHAAFARAVIELVRPGARGAWAASCVEAARSYSWERFGERFGALLARAVQESA